MKATVCELPNVTDEFEAQWRRLVDHVHNEKSDLVLLPEMPFHPWLPKDKNAEASKWRLSVEMHDNWFKRLRELTPAAVISTRPVISSGKHLNEAFIWDMDAGYTALHHKYYLPDDEGWWEASWYERGEKEFKTFQWKNVRVGMLICTELWFGAHAREYMKQDTDMLFCPRATGYQSSGNWPAAGKTAAVVSGAYCLSSNYSPSDADDMHWAGRGWIIDPDGVILGMTSRNEPFFTHEIDIEKAKSAKRTYPRYVKD